MCSVLIDLNEQMYDAVFSASVDSNTAEYTHISY